MSEHLPRRCLCHLLRASAAVLKKSARRVNDMVNSSKPLATAGMSRGAIFKGLLSSWGWRVHSAFPTDPPLTRTGPTKEPLPMLDIWLLSLDVISLCDHSDL